MNTNTVEQAERLEKLGIDLRSEEPDLNAFCYKKFDHKLSVRIPDGMDLAKSTVDGKLLYRLKNVNGFSEETYAGPALTLDDLHRVFEQLNKDSIWPFPSIPNSDVKEIWLCGFSEFKRTRNHTEDLTNILIYLLEEDIIVAEQVNDILADGK